MARRYRHRTKAVPLAETIEPELVDETEETESDDNILHVDVETPNVEKKQESLKDKIFGFIKEDETVKRGRKPKQVKDNVIVSMVPTLVAGFIVGYAQSMLPED